MTKASPGGGCGRGAGAKGVAPLGRREGGSWYPDPGLANPPPPPLSLRPPLRPPPLTCWDAPTRCQACSTPSLYFHRLLSPAFRSPHPVLLPPLPAWSASRRPSYRRMPSSAFVSPPVRPFLLLDGPAKGGTGPGSGVEGERGKGRQGRRSGKRKGGRRRTLGNTRFPFPPRQTCRRGLLMGRDRRLGGGTWTKGRSRPTDPFSPGPLAACHRCSVPPCTMVGFASSAGRESWPPR